MSGAGHDSDHDGSGVGPDDVHDGDGAIFMADEPAPAQEMVDQYPTVDNTGGAEGDVEADDELNNLQGVAAELSTTAAELRAGNV